VSARVVSVGIVSLRLAPEPPEPTVVTMPSVAVSVVLGPTFA
jgi:uncharacterized membrane protein